MAKQTSKMRVIDALDAPERTLYDVDMDFNYLNEIHKQELENETEFEEEDETFNEIFQEDY